MKQLRWALVIVSGALASGCPGMTGDGDSGVDPIDAGLDTPVTPDVRLDVPVRSDTPSRTDTPAPPDVPMDGASNPDTGCPAPVCPPPPPACRYEGGSLCECGTLVCTPAACEPACDRLSYCDQCAAAPTCVVRPPDEGRICTALYMPVCGCDGTTYSNACTLASAGIPALHPGECTPPPVVCSGVACAPDEFCDHDSGCSGDGVCTPRGPGICPDVFMPVCGCDGTTYGNACEATAAGVDVASDGECGCVPACSPGETCELCRGSSGPVYVCLSVGSIC